MRDASPKELRRKLAKVASVAADLAASLHDANEENEELRAQLDAALLRVAELEEAHEEARVEWVTPEQLIALLESK